MTLPGNFHQEEWNVVVCAYFHLIQISPSIYSRHNHISLSLNSCPRQTNPSAKFYVATHASVSTCRMDWFLKHAYRWDEDNFISLSDVSFTLRPFPGKLCCVSVVSVVLRLWCPSLNVVLDITQEQMDSILNRTISSHCCWGSCGVIMEHSWHYLHSLLSTLRRRRQSSLQLQSDRQQQTHSDLYQRSSMVILSPVYHRNHLLRFVVVVVCSSLWARWIEQLADDSVKLGMINCRCAMAAKTAHLCHGDIITHQILW